MWTSYGIWMKFVWNTRRMNLVWSAFVFHMNCISNSCEVHMNFIRTCVKLIWTSYKFLMKFSMNRGLISFALHSCEILPVPHGHIRRLQPFQMQFIWTDRHNIPYEWYQPPVVVCRHYCMGKLSISLALCETNQSVINGSPKQRTRRTVASISLCCWYYEKCIQFHRPFAIYSTVWSVSKK